MDRLKTFRAGALLMLMGACAAVVGIGGYIGTLCGLAGIAGGILLLSALWGGAHARI